MAILTAGRRQPKHRVAQPPAARVHRATSDVRAPEATLPLPAEQKDRPQPRRSRRCRCVIQ